MKNLNWVVVRDINTASVYPEGEKQRDQRPQVAEFSACLKSRSRPGPLSAKIIRLLQRINGKPGGALPRTTLSKVLGEIRAIKGMKLPFKPKKVFHETPENQLAI